MTNQHECHDSLGSLWVKADEAAKSGDYQGLLFALKRLADEGVWQAYARIGEVYEAGGGGVEADIAEALKWYRKAVFEGDDPVAHLGLGRAHYNGEFADRDFVRAFSHFQKAFAAKNPEAAIYLGIMYYFGVGVTRDIARAVEYFEFAASAGYFLAYGYLARIALAEGRMFRSAVFLIKGWLLMVRVSMKDPNDRKLLGIERPRVEA